MKNRPRHGLFITGTDTGVGKSYVTALIARRLVATGNRVGVYKPVASGCRRLGTELIADDAQLLWEAAGRPGALDNVCPQRFEASLAPHLAARQEGRAIDTDLIRDGICDWSDRCDIVLVEGAGGLMSPLSDDDYNVTLAEEFAYPLVIVAVNQLGVINQTLQTLIAAASYGDDIPIAGVILNNIAPQADHSVESNRCELEARCVPPILSELKFNATEFTSDVDWANIATAI